jgi:hypothetical protein
MTEHINLVVDDDTFAQLTQAKEAHGLSWEGLLLHAAKDLDTPEPRSARRPVCGAVEYD